MKINVVVVTYNRLFLLKECIEALQSQTYPINKIFIVDNNSTDETGEYLQTLTDNDQFIIISLPENLGGAGGFSEGIKRAVLNGCEWVWIMDDDTIPKADALEELIKGTSVNEKVGYVCSKVVWTDGMVHQMNLPHFDAHNKQRIPLNYYSNLADVLLFKTASFVSLLINSKAVYEVGLPIKEFFIWGDDTEFTSRIYRHDYVCLYAGHSIVTHKTSFNYVSQIQTAPLEAMWKFEYGFRNETYLRRQRKSGILFLFSTFNAYRRAARHLSRRPQGDKKKFLKAIRRGFWEGLFFKPKIEYIS